MTKFMKIVSFERESSYAVATLIGWDIVGFIGCVGGKPLQTNHIVFSPKAPAKGFSQRNAAKFNFSLHLRCHP